MLNETRPNGHRTSLFLPLLAGTLGASLALGCSGSQHAGPAYPSTNEQSTSSARASRVSDADASGTAHAASNEGTASGAASPQAAEPMAPAPEAERPSAAEVSDSEVETFARAYAEIATIQQSYQQQAAAASSQDELQALQAGMNREVQAALEKEGVSPEQFETIARSAEQHPEVRRRVQQALEEQHQPQAQ